MWHLELQVFGVGEIQGSEGRAQCVLPRSFPSERCFELLLLFSLSYFNGVWVFCLRVCVCLCMWVRACTCTVHTHMYTLTRAHWKYKRRTMDPLKLELQIVVGCHVDPCESNVSDSAPFTFYNLNSDNLKLASTQVINFHDKYVSNPSSLSPLVSPTS